MSKYFPPTYNETAFNCVHCGVYAGQSWNDMINTRQHGTGFQNTRLRWCQCRHCEAISYWWDGQMLIPTSAPVPPFHLDMPEHCKVDYDEARDVVGRSPKAAAALMRLVLQKLMKELGEKGGNINDDIKSLVAKGLPVMAQQALDYCRVVGNNAVHPGEINLNDTPEIAHQLFAMVNFLVEDRISRPKQIEALYAQLPQGARDAIDKRDRVQTADASTQAVK